MSACGDPTVKVTFGTIIIIIINNQITLTQQTPDRPLYAQFSLTFPVVDKGCFTVGVEFSSAGLSELTGGKSEPHRMRVFLCNLARRSRGGIDNFLFSNFYNRNGSLVLVYTVVYNQ